MTRSAPLLLDFAYGTIARDNSWITKGEYSHVTWKDLKQFIEGMPPEDRDGEVRFIEPYDKERAGYCLDAGYAREDLTVGGGDEPETVFVRNGEAFLE
jgi:hypothetical protein